MLEDGQELLFAACEKQFGFHIERAERIELGWLNVKWVLHTDQGSFVLKKYHEKRFKSAEMLHRALHQQQRLCDAGVPCPRLLELEGSVLHTTASGDRYMVMRYCEGVRLDAGKVNEVQMYDFGRVTGSIHQLLNDGTLGAESVPQFTAPARDSRLAHWDALREQVVHEGKVHLVPAIELQYRVTEHLDLESLQLCERGWAHRDLWTDNLLFSGDRISAVLDFDRLNYDYPELDVARAVLSAGWNEGQLRTEAAKAFLDGYREVREFPTGRLVRSIRMLWYLESEWWIRTDMDVCHHIPARFAKEMLWIASNDQHLENMLGKL